MNVKFVLIVFRRLGYAKRDVIEGVDLCSAQCTSNQDFFWFSPELGDFKQQSISEKHECLILCAHPLRYFFFLKRAG